ncbi:metallophosphoesterase [Neolewinella lacunae]|uniref:Metallophosphoesterase n=1 Tax=Neolewinella lacunae TaxID=1517758 RepID=A0A923PNZ6_9BACT|nr:metallophosphoesterase [Neolewinella lacunae]MBC6996216.1 metallophosphoesterase [Neolewinella lacunae]MDN3637173.1 metallophosphoesterase [Neolewinella lacunae]
MTLCLVAVLSSCATYQLNYSSEGENWAPALPDKPVSQTIFLIGDAGNAKDGKIPPALSLLGQQLKRAQKNSTLVFLGDNIYPNGMAPAKKEEERADNEFRLRAQLDILKDYPGKTYFIPGNHDWYKYGVDGLKRQKKFIEDYLDEKDVWQPDCGCGDPKVVDVTDDLVLIMIDSEWWLTDWEGETEINQNCEAKSRENFKLLFEAALKSNREKNVIVALHHPLYSMGPHGGAFPLKDHLFPLTRVHKNLWLPLPIVGSVYPFYRSAIGTKSDMAHPEYRAFRDFVLSVAQKNGQFIFVSGHEHSLQYTEAGNQFFIVSGAGSKRSPTRAGQGTQFAYGNYGFSELIVYEDGSVWVQFWSVDATDEAKGKVVFRKQVKGPLPGKQSLSAQDIPALDTEQKEISLPIFNESVDRKGLRKVFWGAHYRQAYNTFLDYPVLDLSAYQGGVTPVKKGGGYQTNSIRLEAPDGRQYTMRSIIKDASRTIAYPLSQSTLIQNVYADAFNSAHPLAAQAVPPLARAAGVYHTNPRIFYIPQQRALGNYNEDFGNALYLVEERPDGKGWKDHPNLGNPDEIISTHDVIEAIKEHHNHRIDFRAVARARIFDLLIGDWDRHDDQWRWAKIKGPDQTLYRPIPRDRDQAFSKYDGVVYSLARRLVPASRPLRAYAAYEKKIHWSHYGARYFDPTFLSGATWEIWEKELEEIQKSLTDEVIYRAFESTWPDDLYQLDGYRIAQTMIERKKNLAQMARSFYAFHAKKVDVLGTHKKDLFEVVHAKDGTTRIRVYDTNKEGKKGRMMYERTFRYPETKEIRLYGLDNDDVIQLSGDGQKGPLIRIIGGEGKEDIRDASKVKAIIYDDEGKDLTIQRGPKTSVKTSEDPKFNTYNRLSKDYEFDYATVVPSVGVNPDDGFLLGLSTTFVNHGFKKSPFADRHQLSLKYAFGSAGWEFKYQGEIVEAIGKGNLHLATTLRNPLYAFNFYGLGNETENREDTFGVNYNRVLQRYIALQPTYVRHYNRALSVGFGPLFESIRIDLSDDERLINQLEPQLNPEIFEGSEYLGVQAHVRLENLNDPVFPTRGVNFHANVAWTTSLDDGNKHFPSSEGALAIYQQLTANGKLVFATRVGGKHIFNNDFEFFQGATLGGIGPNSNLRGFRRERFTGRSAFYHNTDLRWKAVSSQNNILPFSMGLLAGYDYGRVWLDGEDSDLWHYSFGGGIWISPLDLLDLKFSLFQTDEGIMRFSFGGQFFF